MSKVAAEMLIEKLSATGVNVMGLATGGTPEGMYKQLVKLASERNFSFKDIHTVNLDEYVGLSDEHPNSYHTYMRNHLFDHIDIPDANTHLPNGLAENLDGECERYEKMITDLEQVNIQLLGIGANGHIGFNEPGTSFNSKTQVVQLAESTREANARFFENEAEVPTHAITMGIQTIMESKEIVLLASGSSKAEALYELICGKQVTEKVPATVLQRHPNLTVIADEEALHLVNSVQHS